MNLLRGKPALLDAACTTVAQTTDIPYAHVEKDYWLTEALRAMVLYAESVGITIILKGGTSLSKAFGLIQRFSEDVDVLVVFPELSKGACERHLKALIAAAGAAIDVEPVSDSQRAVTGVKRVARLQYPRRASDSAGSSEGVQLEMHSIGGASPRVVMGIRSLLAEHLTTEQLGEPFDEIEEFEVPVVSACRTLVEKLIILHGAHSDSSETGRHRRLKTVRHYYDVWALLGSPEVLSDLKGADVGVIARDVAVYSESAGLPKVGRPVGGFASSPAFRIPPARSVTDRYDIQVLSQLLWPGADKPSLTECIQRVLDCAESL
jgi:hypothetical protein